MADKDNEKKIIIDQDWKAQAQKEKEELAHEQEKAVEEEKHEGHRLPPANFTGLVSMLATQALFAMGVIAEDKDKARPADLPLAQYHIELLNMLEEKTKNNLDDQEKELIAGALYQLRMTFVKVATAMGIKPE